MELKLVTFLRCLGQNAARLKISPNKKVPGENGKRVRGYNGIRIVGCPGRYELLTDNAFIPF